MQHPRLPFPHATSNRRPARSAEQRRPPLLLILATAICLGSVVAFELTQRLLEAIMDRSLSVHAQAELLNIQDHLLPYRLAAGTLFIIFLLMTSSFWLRQHLPA